MHFFACGLGQPLWGVVLDRFGRVRLQLTPLGTAAAMQASALSGSAATLLTRGLANGLFGVAYSAAPITRTTPCRMRAGSARSRG